MSGSEHDPVATGAMEEPRTEEVEREMALGGRRLLVYGLVVVIILVALYLVLPELAGLEDSLRKIEDADPVWMAVALGFNLLSFAAYIALFRGVIGGGAGLARPVRDRLDWRTSYQITLAGLAATRLFSAGGAGGPRAAVDGSSAEVAHGTNAHTASITRSCSAMPATAAAIAALSRSFIASCSASTASE